MENNELMNVEDIEVMDDYVETEKKSGIGTGGAMLIGAGLVLAVSAGIKLAKKGIAAIKAKKDAKKADEESAIEEDFIEED